MTDIYCTGELENVNTQNLTEYGGRGFQFKNKHYEQRRLKRKEKGFFSLFLLEKEMVRERR